MYLRLAFSVAIHVDPDVLLIDEILAVGDESFQSKCLERISALQSQRVSIVFVSHSLDVVRRLCNRAIWMEQGYVCAEGPTDLVVQRYLDAVAQQQSAELAKRNLEMAKQRSTVEDGFQGEERSNRWGSREVEITQVRMLDCKGEERYVFTSDEAVTIQMRYQAGVPVKNPVFGLALHRSDGIHITGPNTQFGRLELPVITGAGVVEYIIPRLLLLPGRYHISVAAHDAEDTHMFDYHDQMYTFMVRQGGTGERYGLMSMGGEWRHKSEG
jgi:lipopolysaccharide transport system ATP-binding protein